MPEISDRSIGFLVSRLAERARLEGPPCLKTSAQVMTRIRGSSSEAGQGNDVCAKGKPDFRSVLEAKLRKHSES